MKFGEIFEYHKIPEWYNMYLNYELFKQKIDLFQLKKKFNEVTKLRGYYVRTSDGQLVLLDLPVVRVDENMFPEESAEKMVENHEIVINPIVIESTSAEETPMTKEDSLLLQGLQSEMKKRVDEIVSDENLKYVNKVQFDKNPSILGKNRKQIWTTQGLADLVELMMPEKFTSKEVEQLEQVNEYSELMSYSEKTVTEWINQYVDELAQIEKFYKTKMLDKIEAFITLQAQYYSKFHLRYNEDMSHIKCLICPITGDVIKVDNAGQIEKLSLFKIKGDLREQLTFNAEQNFKVKNKAWQEADQVRNSSFYGKIALRIQKKTISVEEEDIEAQDELEFATNWVRAFQKIYREIKWLNSFAIINEIAAQKILKKFMKTHFQIKDNIIDKNLQIYQQNLEFVKRSNINSFIHDIKYITAMFFSNGELSKAKTLLEGELNEISRSNLTIVASLGGALAMTYFFLLLFLFTKNESLSDTFWMMFKAQSSVMRFTFILIYSIFGCGICISVFRKHEINYIHIFDMDYKKKVNEFQLWVTSIILFFIWTIAFVVNCLQMYYQQTSLGEQGKDWTSLVFSILLFVICVQPCLNITHRNTRFELLKTLYQILISPFGTVRFRDFFLADVITSMGQPLVDLGTAMTYFSRGYWIDRNPAIKKPVIYLAIVAYLPFWWRFWQCINKWKNQNNQMQLVNAMKYFSKFGPPTAALLGCAKHFENNSFWFYFGAQLLQTMFCLYWDYHWDWGFFHGTIRNHKLLRDQITFSHSFYYNAVIINFLFRFWWLCAAIVGIDETNIQIWLFVGMMVEAIRRTLWAVIRIENEFFNNFEKYRDIIIIPPMQD